MRPIHHPASIIGKKKFGLSRTYTSHPDRVPDDTFIPLGLHRRENLPSGTAPSKRLETESLGSAPNILLIKSVNIKICLVLIQILEFEPAGIVFNDLENDFISFKQFRV